MIGLYALTMLHCLAKKGGGWGRGRGKEAGVGGWQGAGGGLTTQVICDGHFKTESLMELSFTYYNFVYKITVAFIVLFYKSICGG